MKRPDIECIVVDGSCILADGTIEYKGIHYPIGKELFRKGPYENATNNIAEFLAVVSGMIYSVQHNMTLPVYSDSQTAIAWARNGRHNSTLARTDKNGHIFKLLDQAEEWLAENKGKVAVEKWLTKEWGENPADFGRK